MPLEPGTQLGPYEITSAIGSGGMGEVYRARDHRLERDVAVKVLPTHFKPGTRQLQQFEHEARLLASLNHPSICGIYDVGTASGVTFMVMEHLLGDTLASRIERGPIPVNVALHYALQIAEALKAAHGAGLVHRDIKPGNIMLTTMGVKLLDFGLAKRHMAAPASVPKSGPQSAAATGPVDTAPMEGIVGTLHYMPPEQLAGGVVDARSDIWAFGCVIYEMVAGRRAFDGKTMTEVIAAIVTDRPAVMSIEHGVAPIALEHFVSRCLARDPAERWQSVADLMGELRSMLPHAKQQLPSPAPAPVPESSGSRSSRSKAAAPARASVDAREPAAPRSGVKRAAMMAGVLVVVAAAAWFVGTRLMSRPKQVVAVLPFTSTGADVSDIAEGLPSSLIEELSHAQRVRGVPSSVAFRQDPADPRKAGQALGADRVVTGRLEVRAGRLELDAALIDVSNGSRLWSQHFSRPVADAAELEREVTAATLKALNVEAPARASLPSQVNGEAYRLMLKGRYARSRGDERSLRSALGLFTTAAAKEPALASAFAGIASTSIALAHFSLEAVRPSEALPRAKAAALKALELDSSRADAHASLGFVNAVNDRDWKGAGTEFERAVALQPDDPSTHISRSEWLAAMGRSDEAITAARAAVTLDAKSPEAGVNLGWQLFLTRQYPAAISQLSTALGLRPAMASAHWALGMCYVEAGQFDEALKEMKAAVATAPAKPLYLSGLAYANARAHRTAESTQLLARLRGAPTTEYVSPYGLAVVALALDDTKQAFDLLERAVDEHVAAVVLLATDPRLDPIRSDPRFKDLLKRAGL